VNAVKAGKYYVRSDGSTLSWLFQGQSCGVSGWWVPARGRSHSWSAPSRRRHTINLRHEVRKTLQATNGPNHASLDRHTVCDGKISHLVLNRFHLHYSKTINRCLQMPIGMRFLRKFVIDDFNYIADYTQRSL
jgi:hypothetical protein